MGSGVPRLTWKELIERYELEMQTVRDFGKNKKAVLGYFKHWLGDDRVARTDPAVAAWNVEVNRKKAEKMARRMKAHDDALRAELAKASQR